MTLNQIVRQHEKQKADVTDKAFPALSFHVRRYLIYAAGFRQMKTDS